jgi:predicted flap endonuclease-1-like 5' DNA nuclease
MSIAAHAPALLLFAGGLAAGFLIGWVRFTLRTAAAFVPLATHRDALLTMRQRYRRRLRVMRDLVLRHKLNEEQLRADVLAGETHQATQARLLTGAQAEITTLQERITAMDAEICDRRQTVAEVRAEAQAVAEQLREALDKVAGFEREHGLLRIERDELIVRTQRLRALPASAAQSQAAKPEPEPPTPAPGSRALLADREARIHELECQLRESRNRVSELESSLRTWKYRIAPLALHMEARRDRTRTASGTKAAGSPAQRAEDLTRIRGIGRALARKLRGEGVMHIAQLAGMSPAELANLAVRVGVAASRPQQDRWAEQARELRPAPYAPTLEG